MTMNIYGSYNDVRFGLSPDIVDDLGSVEKVGVAPDPKRVGPASWNLEHG